MKFRATILISLLMMAINGFSQVTVQGRVTDKENGEGVPFVSVLLISAKDSTQIEGVVTDLEGNYRFDNVKVGRYNVKVSSIGYEEFATIMRITLPSTGDRITKNFELQPSTQYLDEVTITASRTQTADRRTYTFTPLQIKSSAHARDLIAHIPNVMEESLGGALKGLRGGSVQLLINGIRANENEVRLIPPHKVKRVEVYDIPPARYRGAEMVLNIITSPLDDGITFGGMADHAVTTGFGNDNLYYSLIRGNHKLTFDYWFNYRNYTKVKDRRDYEYTIGGKAYTLSYDNDTHFGYTTHTPVVKYSYVDMDNFVAEVTIKPSYHDTFNDGAGVGKITKKNEKDQLVNSYTEGRTKIFSPTLDLYFWKKIGEKDVLSLNLQGNYFSTKKHTEDWERIEGVEKPVYENIVELRNNKRSFIGEIAYTRQLSGAQMNSGYLVEYQNLHSLYDNYFGSTDYMSDYLRQYAYTEVTGVYKSFLYRLSLGLTHTLNKSKYVNDSKVVFTPKLVLGKSFGVKHSLRFTYDFVPSPPDINQLSNQRSFLTRDVLSTGNPELRNEYSHSTVLQYTLNMDWVTIGLSGLYVKTLDPIISYFEEDGGKILRHNVNADWQQIYGAALTMNIKPFKNDWLRLQGSLVPLVDELKADKGSYKIKSLVNRLNVTSSYNGFTVAYNLSVPTYSISGGYKSNSEPTNTLSVQYKWKRWTFQSSLFWIGGPSYYGSETIPGSIVKYNQLRQIFDNRNMFTLGVRYHFSNAKEKSYRRTLQNSDTQAPTN